MFNSLKKEKFIMKAIVLFMTLLFLLCGCGGKGRNNGIDENEENVVEDDYLYEEKVVAKHMSDDLAAFLSTNSEAIDIREKIKEASVYDKEAGLNSDCIVSFGEIKKGSSEGKKVNWIVLEKQNGKALLLSQEAMFYLNYSSNSYKNTLNELMADENSEYYILSKELEKIVEEKQDTVEKQKNKYISYENIEDKMNRILVSKMYDDYMRSACFSDDEYNLILNTSIDTRFYDRENNENKETFNRKFFSMSKLEAEKYFGIYNDKYENEKLAVETLNPLKSSKKSSNRKENVDYLLRDGAHYDIYINSDLTVENTYGTKCMVVNDKGYIEPYGTYILSSEKRTWFRPMCIVEYEDNENDYFVINKKEKIERKLDKNKLKKDIDNANVVYNNKKAKTVDDYDTINFGGIDWILIKKEKGQALLQSKNVLFNKAFTQNQDTWYDSTLRKYLNTEFYDNFTNEEKKIISTTKLALPEEEEFKNGVYYKELEKNCSYDKVFVLSPNEIEEYFDVDLHYGENNLERIKPKEYVDGNTNLVTRTDDTDFSINNEMKLTYQSVRKPLGIRPCIVIKYDEKEKIIDAYTDEDENIDVLFYVNKVKNDLISKHNKEVVDTVHYVGRPIDYYDEEFVFKESRYYYKTYENDDNMFPFFDELRSMESNVLGRIDLFINTNSKKYEYATSLYEEDINLNISAFEKGIIKDEIKNNKSTKNVIKETKQDKIQDDGIDIFDKVTFGKYEENSLIWTVVDKDDEKYVLLSDYTFDVKFNNKRKGFLKDDYGENKSNEILDKYFNGKELSGIIIDDDGNRYSVLEYKKYNELFTNKEDRISLGCVTEENFGNKSYFVGGIGEYEKSIVACDKNGDFYNAKDNLLLPNRVLVQVTKDVVEKIEGKNEVELIDFVGDGGLYENYKTKNINFFGEDRLDRLAMFSNDLVYKNDEVIFVDYDGSEEPIKEMSKVKEGSLKVGDIIYYGRYERKEKDDNFNERMIYRVAEIKDNIALLHSAFALPIDKDLINTTNYNNSSVRNYLNGGFYDKLFDEEEKNRIIDSIVEYTDYDYQIQKLEDKIYLLSKEEINKFYTDLNIGTSLAYEILNPRSIVDEYTYLNENYDEYTSFIDRQMQDLSYNFGWNTVNCIEKYPTNKLLENLNGSQYSNIFTTSTQDRNAYIMPSFKIKLGRQEDVANEMIALPDLSLLQFENRGFVYDSSLYFIDGDRNLKVVEYYNNENEVNKDRIQILFKNVGSLYKRNNKIYCVANMEYKENNDNGFGEWVGTLYLIENKNTIKEVYNNVSEVLHNVNDEKVEFYTNFSTGGRFIGEITVSGKIYHLEKDKVYDDKNKFVKDCVDITENVKNHENINDSPSNKTEEDNPLNSVSTYDRYIEFMGNYYLGWYDKKIKFDDYFELNNNVNSEDSFDYESIFNELKGQELAYRGEDVLLKENNNYKTLCTNIIEYYKLSDKSFAIVYEAELKEKIDFIDFLNVEKLSKRAKISEVKDQIYFELKNYLIRKNGGKLQIYNNDKFYDVHNSQNIKYGSWFLNHYDGWYVKDFIDEEVYDLTFDGTNYITTDLGFKMRYSIHIYKNGNMLYAMINDNGKFDILLYDRKEIHFIQEMDFKTYEAVVKDDKVVKLKSYKNNLHDIDLSNYQ